MYRADKRVGLILLKLFCFCSSFLVFLASAYNLLPVSEWGINGNKILVAEQTVKKYIENGLLWGSQSHTFTFFMQFCTAVVSQGKQFSIFFFLIFEEFDFLLINMTDILDM